MGMNRMGTSEVGLYIQLGAGMRLLMLTPVNSQISYLPISLSKNLDKIPSKPCFSIPASNHILIEGSNYRKDKCSDNIPIEIA